MLSLACFALMILGFMGFGVSLVLVLNHQSAELTLSIGGLALAISLFLLFVILIRGLDECMGKLTKKSHETFEGEPFRVGDHPPFRTGSSMRRQS